MKLPSAENAIIDPLKIQRYCLNSDHPVGKHKAKVFKSVLGFTARDSDTLETLIRQALSEQEAQLGVVDIYGQRYIVDFSVTTAQGDAVVRSTWIILAGETTPRLTSAYIR